MTMKTFLKNLLLNLMAGGIAGSFAARLPVSKGDVSIVASGE